MLPYSQFDECIYFLMNPVDSSFLSTINTTSLLGTPEKIYKSYIQYFTAELEEKIVNINNQEQKEDLIRLYISRLMKSKNHRSIKDILPGLEVIDPPEALKYNPRSNRNTEMIFDTGIPFTRIHEQLFSRGCNILYHFIFDELQRCCVTFGIPFLRICKALNFDLETINVEYYKKNTKLESANVQVKSNSDIQSKKPNDYKLEFEKALREIRNSDKEYWNGVPMTVIVDHFKVMSLRMNKNGRPFLTKEELISFLKRGFMNETDEPRQKINCAIGEKGFVIKRFYEFYELAVTDYGHPQKKERFIKLFVDCFDNWDQHTIELLFLRNKSSDKW